MSDTLMKEIFVEGAIPPEMVAEAVGAYRSGTGTGAHSLFLGRVRADRVGERKVRAIEYSAYREMARKKVREIRESAISRYELTGAEIRHSLGTVEAGELCLLVCTCSAHRAAAGEACRHIVETVKAEVPIFGKELFDDATHQWKVNR